MKIRHVYDLHKMLMDHEISSFFDSSEFDAFICRVAQDDVTSFRNNIDWLERHPVDALLFREIEGCWNAMKAVYVSDFSGLVYGGLPGEQQVLETLIRIKERLMAVAWNIDMDGN